MEVFLETPSVIPDCFYEEQRKKTVLLSLWVCLSDLFVSSNQICTQGSLLIANSPSGNLFLAPDSGCFGTSCLTISGLGLSIHAKDKSGCCHEDNVQLMFINHGDVLRRKMFSEHKNTQLWWLMHGLCQWDYLNDGTVATILIYRLSLKFQSTFPTINHGKCYLILTLETKKLKHHNAYAFLTGRG